MDYLEIVKKIGFEIPSEEYREVLEQPECEYDIAAGFFGFLEPYEAVAEFVPKNRIIIDFGCYLYDASSDSMRQEVCQWLWKCC